MSSNNHHGLQAFIDVLAVENERMFIVYRGKRCWFDWRMAHEFAYFTSLLTRRKESVHGVFVAGRWYWHVRVIQLTDDGEVDPGGFAGSASASARAPLAPQGGAAASPSSLSLLRQELAA